jgi:hypothetical protein
VDVTLNLQQAMKTQSGSGGTSVTYSFVNLSARCGRVVNAMPWPFYPWERDLVLIV